MTATRVTAGVPTGGQFAATDHAEPTVALDTDADLTPAQKSAAAIEAFGPAQTAFERADAAKDHAEAFRGQAAGDVIRTAVLEAYPAAATLGTYWHDNSQTTVWDRTVFDDQGNDITLDPDDEDIDPATREVVERAHRVAESHLEYIGFADERYELDEPSFRMEARPDPVAHVRSLAAAFIGEHGGVSADGARIRELLAAVAAL